MSLIPQVHIFLCGDVMTGRGIDQILTHPCSPELYESYVKDARDYVRLAERLNGNIPLGNQGEYIWGDGLHEFNLRKLNFRLINLETSITTSNTPWPYKGINYRMHPKNIDAITSAKIDVCALANNHVLDWGIDGFFETMMTLDKAKIGYAGAGENFQQAATPAIHQIPGFNLNSAVESTTDGYCTDSSGLFADFLSHRMGDTHQQKGPKNQHISHPRDDSTAEFRFKGRILVFSMGLASSGILQQWKATAKQPGVWLLSDLGKKTIKQIKEVIEYYRKVEDLCIVSIHWGGNWGYDIPMQHQQFARVLIDEVGVNVIHGHSSHHPIGIELHNQALILYGCGDLINDYEGIGGWEQFRSDVSLMYFCSFDERLRLTQLELVPMVRRNFKLNYASDDERQWLVNNLKECSQTFHTPFTLEGRVIYCL